ncbi:GTP cyclohydrolase I [Rhizobium sp. BK456]|uniref:GTP cyclohydrolase I n=1 Tax=Rhizobium sp. BK456 TaxID=2587007 RepID=UPI00160FCC16|nr:GTP cyclohydrolase I [Rhizobium sp. BK456]MBB3527230.1 GTP cyclohydrolase I [Rhizobium sp. BK456]
MDAIVTDTEFLRASDIPTQEEAEAAVRTLIRWAGDDPSREGLHDTPARVAKAYRELFAGYDTAPEDILAKTFSDVAGYGDMVVVKDIQFHSHCEHHMVPFHGVAHIAYVPEGGVLGLSKMARLVDIYVRPKGVAVMIEAEHMCMAMRGIQRQGAKTITTVFIGQFERSAEDQSRFMMLARG